MGSKISKIVRYIHETEILMEPEKCPFGLQKTDNKPSEPQKEIWAPKSAKSSDISIDRKSHM
jgi:hypothetical protein